MLAGLDLQIERRDSTVETINLGEVYFFARKQENI